jgi:hypothetical protein
MHLAITDMYRAKWTDEIFIELIYNLWAKSKDLDKDFLVRTRTKKNKKEINEILSARCWETVKKYSN